VKVLVGNYQAEYGRRSGANITLVSKAGTQQFHGLFSYFKRHEQFNANNFFRNRDKQARPATAIIRGPTTSVPSLHPR
jgi:hypothetical protein